MVKIDESFLGASRVRGRPGPLKKGRGTLKHPVSGTYERDGAVCAEPVTGLARLGRFKPS